jgi:hypothetical protein
MDNRSARNDSTSGVPPEDLSSDSTAIEPLQLPRDWREAVKWMQDNPVMGGMLVGEIALGAAVVSGALEVVVGAGAVYAAYRLLQERRGQG